MYVDRNWKISENEKTDSIIARVTAQDNENDILTFGLEKKLMGFEKDDRPLPFRIDNNTGVVYLNDSLVGRGGEQFFLYITVFDGEVTIKNEIYVKILKENSDQQYSDSYAPPSFRPNIHNITHLLPPFHLLPGVNRPPSSSSNENSQPSVYQSNVYTRRNTTNDDKGPVKTDNENRFDKTSTVLAAVDNDRNSNTQVHTYPNHRPTNEKDDSSTGGNIVEPNLALIGIIFGVIFLAAFIIAIYMFRQHLSAFGKSLKKKSKEEMAKKSNQSNISTITITEDSRNSMVLQNWNGPMAFNNRYVPWERDNQHIQV